MTDDDKTMEIKALRAAAPPAREWDFEKHGSCESQYYHRGYKPPEFSPDGTPTVVKHG